MLNFNSLHETPGVILQITLNIKMEFIQCSGEMSRESDHVACVEAECVLQGWMWRFINLILERIHQTF